MQFPDCAIILGGQPLNLNIINRFSLLGLKVIVVDYRAQISISCDKHLVHDAKDPFMGQYLKKQGISSVKCVYTSMDDAGTALYSVCKQYNLHCSNIHALTAAHDKKLMHEKWESRGILNRYSQPFCTFNESLISKINSKYDIILKPTDSCASRGVSIIKKTSSLEILKKAFSYAKSNSTSGFVNVEEFVHGQEFTVELLGDSFGNVSVYGISKKYHTANTYANKIAVKLHYNPADIDDVLYEKIASFARDCFRAIGLTCSLGHLEVILKKDGILTPVEIGARSSGFIASDLVDLASGSFFLKDYLDVQNGGCVKDGTRPRGENSSMYFFYDIPANSVARRTSSILPYLRPFAKSIFHDRKKIKKGEKFCALSADTDRYGYEILYGERSDFTIEKLLKAEEKFIEEFVSKGENENIDISIPIFDSIVHPTIDGSWLNKRYDGLAHIADLQADMSSYNIQKAFAVGMHNIGGYSLEKFLEMAKNDDRLLPIAFWRLNYDVTELLRLKKMGYVGIKIHPRLLNIKIDDKRIIDAISLANKIGLIVLLCSFDGITEKFSVSTKKLTYILLHSGFEKLEDTTNLVLKNNPFAILDLSYTLYNIPEKAALALDLITKNPTRFCIGSDHPEINHFQLRKYLNRTCKFLTDEHKNLLFNKNLERYANKFIHRKEAL